MKEYEEAIKKLNKDNEFRMHITEEEDAQLMFESSMELAEDRGAKQKSIEVAKKMLLEDEDIDKIVKFTGLSLEEIKTLMTSL